MAQNLIRWFLGHCTPFHPNLVQFRTVELNSEASILSARIQPKVANWHDGASQYRWIMTQTTDTWLWFLCGKCHIFVKWLQIKWNLKQSFLLSTSHWQETWNEADALMGSSLVFSGMCSNSCLKWRDLEGPPVPLQDGMSFSPSDAMALYSPHIYKNKQTLVDDYWPTSAVFRHSNKHDLLN